MLKSHRHILIAVVLGLALTLPAGAMDLGLGLGVHNLVAGGALNGTPGPAPTFLLLVGGGNITLVGGGIIQCQGTC